MIKCNFSTKGLCRLAHHTQQPDSQEEGIELIDMVECNGIEDKYGCPFWTIADRLKNG